MQKHKVCSFFGHRKINITEELKEKVKSIIEDLILNHGVTSFLFGSRSEFDYLCHLLVTELKEKYPNIKRIAYTCKSESCILENEKEKWKRIFYNLHKEEVNILGYEEEFEHKTKFNAGRASYIERNQAMIDDSDCCVFYYNENYTPPTKTNSGTKIAYKYALKKNKHIINLIK